MNPDTLPPGPPFMVGIIFTTCVFLAGVAVGYLLP